MEERIGKRRGLIGGGGLLLLALCVADAILGCNASVGGRLGRLGGEGQEPTGGGDGVLQHQNRQAPGGTVVSENPRHVADVAAEAVFKSGRPLRDLAMEKRPPNDSQGRPHRKDEGEGGHSAAKHALRKSPRVKAAAATYPGHDGYKHQQQQDGSTPVSTRLGKTDERAAGAKTAAQAAALASATDESSPEIRAGSGTGVRFPTDEFLGFLCSCPGGCRTINATHGRLDDGGGDRCDKTGVTGSYGNRATCWWIINADPGTTVTLTKNLMDYAEYVWTDALTIETCKPTDPMCREPEPLGDQWADVTNAAASTFTVPNGTFIVQMKADALWTHEGFELIWGPPGPRVCGDGAMDFGYETCDDGNTVDGDGCSATCQAEPGYTCDASGCNCTCCGDFDANMTSGSVQFGGGSGGYAIGSKCWYTIKTGVEIHSRFTSFGVEPGDTVAAYQCDVATHACTVIDRVYDELSQPGVAALAAVPADKYLKLEMNTTGCTAGHGFAFEWGPAALSCGDGTVGSLEECDDGNTDDNDGCSSQCIKEVGFNCNGTAPSVCAATCGDGIKAASEQCDDGNNATGDGCSDTCTCEQTPCAYTCSPTCHLGSLVQTATTGTRIVLAAGTYDDFAKHRNLVFNVANVTLAGSGPLAHRRSVIGDFNMLGDVDNIVDLIPAFEHRGGSFFPHGLSAWAKAADAALTDLHFDGPVYVYPTPGNKLTMERIDGQSVRIFGQDRCSAGASPCAVHVDTMNVVRMHDYRGVFYVDGKNIELHVSTFYCRDAMEAERFRIVGEGNTVYLNKAVMSGSPHQSGRGFKIEGDGHTLTIDSSEIHGFTGHPTGYTNPDNKVTRNRMGKWDGSGGTVFAEGNRNKVHIVNVDSWNHQAEYRASMVFMLGNENYYFEGNGTIGEEYLSNEEVGGSYMVGNNNTMHFARGIQRNIASPNSGWPCWDYYPDLNAEGVGQPMWFCYQGTCGGDKLEGDDNTLIIEDNEITDLGNRVNDWYGGQPDGGVCVEGNRASVRIVNSNVGKCETSLGRGGALSIKGDDHTVTVIGSTMTGSSAVGAYGGTIAVYGGSRVKLHVEDSTISKSIATRGGAVSMVGSGYSLDVLRSDFAVNHALKEHGAAIFFDDITGSINIDNSSLTENTAATSGGAIWSNSMHLGLKNTHVKTNLATSEHGGGIFYSGGAAGCSATIDSSYLLNNQGVTGGGLYVTGCEVTATHTEVSENKAETWGAGIYFDGKNIGPRLTVSDSKFAENEISIEGGGAGVYLINGDLNISGSTFEANSAVFAKGAGLYVTGNAGSDTQSWDVKSSTFKSNTADSGAGAYVSGNIISSTDIRSGTGIPLRFQVVDGAEYPSIVISGEGGNSPMSSIGGQATDHTLRVVPFNATQSLSPLIGPDYASFMYYYDQVQMGERWPEDMTCSTQFVQNYGDLGTRFGDTPVWFGNPNADGVIDQFRDWMCVETPVVSLGPNMGIALAMEQVGDRIFAMNVSNNSIIATVPTSAASIKGAVNQALFPDMTIQTVTGLSEDSLEAQMGWGLVGANSDKILVGGTFDQVQVFDMETLSFESIECASSGHDASGQSGGYMAAAVSQDSKTVYLARYMGSGQAFDIWQWNRNGRQCSVMPWSSLLGLRPIRALAISSDGTSLYMAEKESFTAQMNEMNHIRIVSIETGSASTLISSTDGNMSPLTIPNIVAFHITRSTLLVLSSPTGFARSTTTTWKVYSMDSGTLEFDGVTLDGNHAARDGAGVKLEHLSLMSKIQFKDVLGINNEAVTGAALSFNSIQGSISVTGGELHDNTASSNGAGLSSRALSDLVMDNIKVHSNSAQQGGGGLHMTSIGDPSGLGVTEGANAGKETVSMNNVEVYGNVGDLGGGMLLEGDVELSAHGCKISDNAAGKGAGVHLTDRVVLHMDSCDAEDNRAATCGGFVSSSSEKAMRFTSSVNIRRNEAQNGGAVCNLHRNGLNHCLAESSASPTYFMVSALDGPASFNSNNASMGGGTFFAACLSPHLEFSGSATDPPQALLGSASDSVAGYGGVYASVAHSLELVGSSQEVSDMTKYTPGDPLKTKLVMKDSWGRILKMQGGSMPYKILVQLAGPDGQVYLDEMFEFNPTTGVCDLAMQPTPLKWPRDSSLLFVDNMSLVHKVVGVVEGIQVPDLRAAITRQPCGAGETFDSFTSTCKGCEANEYIIDPDVHTCQKCPEEGGRCDGKKLTPITNGSVWEASDEHGAGKMLLRSCPAGYMLINSTDATSSGTFLEQAQKCQLCLPGTEYINFPNQQSCMMCPVGAKCDGKSATGAIPGSVWAIEGTPGKPGNGLTRLQQCPGGYVLVRDEKAPLQDVCVECPPGKYLVDVAKWSPSPSEPRLVSSSASLASSLCIDCTDGLKCNGGNRVFQRKGFWSLGPEGEETLPARRQTTSATATSVTTTNATVIRVYQCQGNACIGNDTCAYPCPNNFSCDTGRYGPVCGMCMDGWTESQGRCVTCDPEATEQSRRMAWGFGITISMIVWAVVSWRPLFVKPQDENESKAKKTVMDIFGTLFSGRGSNQMGRNDTASEAVLPTRSGAPPLQKRGSLMSLKQRHGGNSLRRIIHSVGTMEVQTTMRGIVGYLKIVISFYQILSTFPITFFQLDWSSSNDDVMENSKWSRVEIFSIPDFSCILQGMRFRDKLLWYTIAPMIISILLVIPTIVVLVLGKMSREGAWTSHPKYKDVTANYFWAQSFFMFLIYPTVSMMALSAVNCRKIGEYWVLAIDVGEKCTLSDTSGGLFPLAVAAIIIYPIGVPVIIYCLLWFQRVPHLAERKRNRALVQAMVSNYKLSIMNGTTEMVLRYLGARQVADSEIDAHVKSEAFKDKVTRLYEQQYSDKGKNKSSDDDAGLLATLGLTGYETLDQFFEAMARMVREHNMFSGHETPESLTAVQCRTLIRHFERDTGAEDDLHEVSIESLQSMTILCSHSMMRRGAISVPTLSWSNANSPAERRVLRRVGNLFVAFKVEHWYYEIINTLHKLFVTSVLVFCYPGEYMQYAIGIAMVYLFLLITMRIQPYVISILSNLQMYTLVILIISLFYGMMKSINDFSVNIPVRDFDPQMPLTLAVAVLCATVPIAPFVWESIIGWMHTLHWFKSDKEDQLIKEFETTNMKSHVQDLRSILPTAPPVENQPTPAPQPQPQPQPQAPAAAMLATTHGAPSSTLPPPWTGTAPAYQAVFNGNGAPTPVKTPKKLNKLRPLPNMTPNGGLNKVAPGDS